MDDNKLDALLKSFEGQFKPALPDGFSRNVWKEIDARKKQQSSLWTYWDDLFSSFLNPRFIVASLLIASFIGTAGTSLASLPSDSSRASSALSLSIFSPSASTVPLLYRR